MLLANCVLKLLGTADPMNKAKYSKGQVATSKGPTAGRREKQLAWADTPDDPRIVLKRLCSDRHATHA